MAPVPVSKELRRDPGSLLVTVEAASCTAEDVSSQAECALREGEGVSVLLSDHILLLLLHSIPFFRAQFSSVH